jgi:hypothetical protein
MNLIKKGTFNWTENKVYTGEWKANALHGYGTFIQKGKVFKGHFLNDKKHGLGINIYPNSSYIISKYEDDLMVGISLFYDKESNKEMIYHAIKGKNKQLVDNEEEVEKVKGSKEFLDLKSFLNELKSNGQVQF